MQQIASRVASRHVPLWRSIQSKQLCPPRQEESGEEVEAVLPEEGSLGGFQPGRVGVVD